MRPDDSSLSRRTAIWAITPNGAAIAEKLADHLNGDIFLSHNIGFDLPVSRTFDKLKTALTEVFSDYRNHVFIMAVGIVVRIVGPMAVHKKSDPAVVVVDDAGRFAISLLSGHIGMANKLAAQTAEIIGAMPVITTATDVNQLFAVDAWAVENNIAIENHGAIKSINMALIRKEKPNIYDPYGFMDSSLKSDFFMEITDLKKVQTSLPAVIIDDRKTGSPENALLLRPPTLAAGMGCNRNTDADEMETLLKETFRTNGLSPLSLFILGSVDLKKDETGLLVLCKRLGIAPTFYDKNELNRVERIVTPSETVHKHTGTKSVCEAAAILASGGGELIIPKQRSKNATIALARINCLS